MAKAPMILNRPDDDTWRDQSRQQALLLVLARFSFAFTIVWVPISIWLKSPEALTAALLAVFGSVIPLLLRAADRHALAVAGWITFLSLGILGGALALGDDSQLETILFVLPGLPFLLLSYPRQRRQMLLLMLVPMAMWVAHRVLVGMIEAPGLVDPQIARGLLAPLAGLTTFASVAFQCAYFSIKSRSFVATINAARRASEQSSRAKTAFLSGISHEMRTPLNGVIGLSELIRMEALRRGDPQLEDYAVKIAQSGNALLGTVEKAMHFADLSSGRAKVNLRPLRLEPVVERVFARFTDAAASARVALQRSDLSADVLADPDLIEDVLGQIIDNSVRYGGTGATVTVSASPTTENTVRIVIEDTGPGFATSDPEAAFAPFERLNHTAGVTFGAGMGLAIARLKAEAMDGQITIDLEPHRGARLILDLPAAASGQAA